jgi:hypothetical protein
MIPDALKLFQQKESVPSEMLTKDWAMVDVWTKERSFWMAGVEDVNILQAFRDEAEKMAGGTSSGNESMNRLTLYLEKIGYQPEKGEEGSIKDLSSWRRMSVALDTNVSMMRGWGMRERALNTLRIFPAWQFRRISDKEEKREWAARWQVAYELTKNFPGATPSSGDDDAPGVAMIAHPIWAVLSQFGNPYPLFDWGSGMGVMRVSRSKAKKIFDLDDPRIKAMWETRPVMESPNKSLQANPAVTDDKLKESLNKRLGGLAKWDGDTLVHTDPNGSKPSSQSDLIASWDHMPDGFETKQKDSLNTWLENPDAEYESGGGIWDDIERLAERLEPSEEIDLYKQLPFLSKDERDSFVEKFTRDGYQTGFNAPAESWTSKLLSSIKDTWSILFKAESTTQAKDVRELVKLYHDNPNVIKNSEFLYVKGVAMEVVKADENTATKVITLTLREKVTGSDIVKSAFDPRQSRGDDGRWVDEDGESGDSEAMDKEYMKAVESGDVEAQQAMVDDRAKEMGYNLSHRRKKEDEDPRETGHVIQFTDYDNYDENLNYGDYNYLIKSKDLQDVPDWAVDWYVDESGFMDSYKEFNPNESKDDVWREAWDGMNPKNIVDSAQFWDDGQGVSAFWSENESRLLKDNIKGFTTPNGAVIFDSHELNIKSADPITYDDNGKVIPLSERFNEDLDDIRSAFNPEQARDENGMWVDEGGESGDSEAMDKEYMKGTFDSFAKWRDMDKSFNESQDESILKPLTDSYYDLQDDVEKHLNTLAEGSGLEVSPNQSASNSFYFELSPSYELEEYLIGNDKEDILESLSIKIRYSDHSNTSLQFESPDANFYSKMSDSEYDEVSEYLTKRINEVREINKSVE